MLLGCRNFFVFTIPFVRGVLYSVGAYFSSLVITTGWIVAVEKSLQELQARTPLVV